MASGVLLRPTLAVAKRPLLPFQLGTSTSSVPDRSMQYLITHPPPTHHTTPLTRSLPRTNTHAYAYAHIHTYTKQHAVQQPTSPTFPVAVRPIIPLFAILMPMIIMSFLVLNSDLQGHCERTDDFPPCEQVTRILPLDVRASACRQSRPPHRRRLRDLWLAYPAP